MRIALTPDERLDAVMRRDAALDGAFVFAVTTTGVYCRPSCRSRHPRPGNVRFFDVPAAAEQAGFRPCKRCRPQDAAPVDPAAAHVEQAARLIAQAVAQGETPTLAAIGDQVHLSPFHLQRLFKRLMGITPREYADALRAASLRAALHDGADVTSAAFDAGYGSLSALYERAHAEFGMTPGSYRAGAPGQTLRLTFANCPLGRLAVAATASGIAAVALGADDDDLRARLTAEFPGADFVTDDETLAQWVAAILAYLDGWQPSLDLPLDVRGTAFQRRVWRELQAIPYGETRTYAQIAQQIGQPSAARAVARACATNPAALVIPCHRVVRGDGSLGGYKWGMERKARLLDGERSER